MFQLPIIQLPALIEAVCDWSCVSKENFANVYSRFLPSNATAPVVPVVLCKIVKPINDAVNE
jgi:hypothetical protein